MIAVDIGNTNMHFVWFKGAKISKVKLLPTAAATSAQIKETLSPYYDETVAICSVVPAALRKFRGYARNIYLAGKNLTVPIKSLYNPKHIGMDRLVGAYAAYNIFPRARVIIDFGTAITMDFLSPKGVYQGGIILPGIGSTQQVFSRCALLPKKIVLRETARAVPRNTPESISKGIEAGFSAMLNGLFCRYKRALKITSRDRIVITGGEAVFIRPHLDFPNHYEPLLVCKGLYLLTRKYQL